VRLMMQSLLADRFSLAIHFETRTVPVFELVIAKTGKLGQHLRPHSEGPPCPADSSPNLVPDINAVFPQICEVYLVQSQPNGILRMGARNTTMELLAAM